MTNRRGLVVLAISTWAFTVCFAAWMMFGIIGIPLRQELQLNSTQFGLLTAMPVLTGSVFRLPLGIWTDRFGGRIVMLLLLVLCAVPLWFASYATALWQFLLLGLALGLVGASFSVGTPYACQRDAHQSACGRVIPPSPLCEVSKLIIVVANATGSKSTSG